MRKCGVIVSRSKRAMIHAYIHHRALKWQQIPKHVHYTSY